MITKEFQEWVGGFIFNTREQPSPAKTYKILQQNPHWLFGDMGDAEKVYHRFKFYNAIKYDSAFGKYFGRFNVFDSVFHVGYFNKYLLPSLKCLF